MELNFSHSLGRSTQTITNCLWTILAVRILTVNPKRRYVCIKISVNETCGNNGLCLGRSTQTRLNFHIRKCSQASVLWLCFHFPIYGLDNGIVWVVRPKPYVLSQFTIYIMEFIRSHSLGRSTQTITSLLFYNSLIMFYISALFGSIDPNYVHFYEL